MKKRLPTDVSKRIEDVVALGQISLPLYALEKDYHVLDAIRLLSAAPPSPYFRLVFCGGTCLSKAHGILERMSEDVDFKVVPTTVMSKSKLREALSAYVKSLMDVLDAGGFRDDAIVRRSRDNNTYTRLDVSFDSAFPLVVSMRPHLLIELNYTAVADSTEQIEVGVLLDKLTDGAYIAPFKVECVSLREAVAEKLVSFPRRLALLLQDNESPETSLTDAAQWDAALVRHIYDVHQIVSKRSDILADSAKMREMVAALIFKDAEDFKNQHPSFAENPVAELNVALSFTKTSDTLKQQYDSFVSDMVYADDSGRPPFDEALEVFETALQQVLVSDFQ